MKILKTALVTVGLLIAGTGFAAAENWGAIAIGPNGAYGWAYDFPSRQAAENAALSECGGRCQRKLSFADTCGAYATATDASGNIRAYGWATRQSKEEAQMVAMQECSKYGQGCRVHVWACTTR